MTIRDRMIQLRNIHGLTRAEFAEKSGINYHTISKIENENREPSISTLRQICKAYNMTLEKFFIGVD